LVLILLQLHLEGCAEGGYGSAEHNRAPRRIGLYDCEPVLVGELLDFADVVGTGAMALLVRLVGKLLAFVHGQSSFVQ
jgi:hypothetical protein